MIETYRNRDMSIYSQVCIVFSSLSQRNAFQHTCHRLQNGLESGAGHVDSQAHTRHYGNKTRSVQVNLHTSSRKTTTTTTNYSCTRAIAKLVIKIRKHDNQRYLPSGFGGVRQSRHLTRSSSGSRRRRRPPRRQFLHGHLGFYQGL